MAEHVILVVGPAGSGKSTAIATLFGAEDDGTGGLAGAATAVDFGQLELGPGETVRVYGVPAHGRYDYMWQILKRRALGVLALVSGAEAAPVAELLAVVDEFAELQARGGLLVGITHADAAGSPDPIEVQAALAARFASRVTPVLTLDPRDRGQLITAVSVLAASVDSRELFAD